MTIFKNSLILLFVITIIFTSCEKDDKGKSTAPPEPNLSGQEFIFNNLFWNDNDMGNSICYVNDPNLFKPSRQIAVAVKRDTATVWVPVVNARENPQATGYLYYVSNQGIINVWPNPADATLIGTRVSLRVRFL